MTEQKTCLLSSSDGLRGVKGRAKIYLVSVRDCAVTLTWGMAEKAGRQTKIEICSSTEAALAFAKAKIDSKLASGYTKAYEV